MAGQIEGGRRPSRLRVRERARPCPAGVRPVAEVGEILDRHAHLEVKLPAHARRRRS